MVKYLSKKSTSEAQEVVHQKLILEETILKEIISLSQPGIKMEEKIQQPASDRHVTVRRLSPDEILFLLEQHFACKNSQRLPVLAIAAAYMAVSNLGQDGIFVRPADVVPAPLLAGDVEITSTEDQRLISVYQIKNRKINKEDIDKVYIRLLTLDSPPGNFFFVSTDQSGIDPKTEEYLQKLSRRLGIVLSVLNCFFLLRHYLHFFKADGKKFLDIYQQLLLSEPDSAVAPSIKEFFISARASLEKPPKA